MTIYKLAYVTFILLCFVFCSYKYKMNIFALKDVLFCDLKDPMGFLKHRGFNSNKELTSARAFGDTVYFYTTDGEWTTTTPECTVSAASVNDFKGEEHFCRLKVSNDWMLSMRTDLKNAARIAFDQQLLRRAVVQYPTFEAFWDNCSVPAGALQMSTFAYTKRGHKKQFINMYNEEKEITGSTPLIKGSTVKVPIRWTLSESGEDGRIEFGFRAQFCAGIELVKLGGNPPTLKRPWDWSTVDFATLSVPMYDSFSIRTPAMEIVENLGHSIRVDLSKKPNFKEAMCDFHQKSGSDEWDGTMYFKKSKSAPVGHFASASLVAVRNRTRIEWHIEKLLIVPLNQNRLKKQEILAVTEDVQGQKRDADNMGNFPAVKTKRLCI